MKYRVIHPAGCAFSPSQQVALSRPQILPRVDSLKPVAALYDEPDSMVVETTAQIVLKRGEVIGLEAPFEELSSYLQFVLEPVDNEEAPEPVVPPKSAGGRKADKSDPPSPNPADGDGTPNPAA